MRDKRESDAQLSKTTDTGYSVRPEFNTEFYLVFSLSMQSDDSKQGIVLYHAVLSVLPHE